MEPAVATVRDTLGDAWEHGRHVFYHEEDRARIRLDPDDETYEAEIGDASVRTGTDLTTAARSLEEDHGYDGTVKEVVV